MSFSAGKGALKLKGDGAVKKKHKKKKKDKGKDEDLDLALVESENPSQKETAEGVQLEKPSELADTRTAAEKRYDEQMQKREAERIAKMTEKTHRQRVAEFNAHLSKLTEHMDIPKVGPG